MTRNKYVHAALTVLLCAGAFAAWYFLSSGGGQQAASFVSRRRALPELGTFQIRNGYVSSLSVAGEQRANDPLTNGLRLVAWPGVFLNNPTEAGGIANFGFTTYGKRWSLDSPGVVHGTPVLLDAGHGYAQLHRFPCCFTVNTRWTWTTTELRLLATVHVRAGTFVKEPEFAVALWNVPSVTIPACRTYVARPDADPRRSTGHCDDPRRADFYAGPLHVIVGDSQLRAFGRQARGFAAMGDSGCGWRSLAPSWEIVSWKGATSILVKAWDGCVTETDATRFFRLPPRPARLDFAMTITRR